MIKVQSFKGKEFQALLRESGIRSVPTTARNPQGNSAIKSIHLLVGQIKRMLIDIHNPRSVAQAKALIDESLAMAMHAMRCLSTQALQGLSPGTVVLQTRYFLDIPFYADILTLQENRQDLIDRGLLRENAARIVHDYQAGEQVLKKSVLSLSDKLKPSLQDDTTLKEFTQWDSDDFVGSQYYQMNQYLNDQTRHEHTSTHGCPLSIMMDLILGRGE